MLCDYSYHIQCLNSFSTMSITSFLGPRDTTLSSSSQLKRRKSTKDSYLQCRLIYTPFHFELFLFSKMKYIWKLLIQPLARCKRLLRCSATLLIKRNTSSSTNEVMTQQKLGLSLQGKMKITLSFKQTIYTRDHSVNIL